MDGSGARPETKPAPTITLVSGDPEEEQAGWQLLRLLQRYDLRKWQFTDAVHIDRTARIPHSAPVLTLNTRDLNDDQRALATYLHEQLHWFANSRQTDLSRAIGELRERFPSVPSAEVGGAQDKDSAYLQLVLCALEYAALRAVLGAETARATLERADRYTGLYAMILRDWEHFTSLLSRHGLLPSNGQAAKAPEREEAERRAGGVAQRPPVRWRVRPVESGDASAWEQMRQALWPAAPGEHAAAVERFFAGSRHEPAEVLVALDEAGQPIGFAELSIRSHADGCESNGVGYLEGWFVQEAHRRSGVGAALIRAAEDWARAQGCTEFASDAEIDNAVSLAAHKALGFEEVSRVVTFRKAL
jgi:aminoglycoside 6'-N-acetyltransferase I